MAADQYLVHYVYDKGIISGMVSAESEDQARDVFAEEMRDLGGIISIDVELLDNQRL